MGTPRYMAPEAWRGETATPRTDLYSLGVVLYELCAGRPPHEQTVMPLLGQAVMMTDAPRLVVPGIPPGLAALVDRCLRRDPAQRFSSAEDLLQALEALRGPQPARRPRGWLLAVGVGGALAAGLAALSLLAPGPGPASLQDGGTPVARPGPPATQAPPTALPGAVEARLPDPVPPAGAAEKGRPRRQHAPRAPERTPSRTPDLAPATAAPAPQRKPEEPKNDDIPIER